MRDYDACEVAYKNGQKDAIKTILSVLEDCKLQGFDFDGTRNAILNKFPQINLKDLTK